MSGVPNIFFTSDQHYGHKNVINFCNRPFLGIDHMTDELIRRHNERVKPGDLVYNLGDMFWRTFGTHAAHGVMDRLNGQHYFVFGNHDELIENYQPLRSRFIWAKELVKIQVASRKDLPKVVLCHYAMRVWDGSHNGNLHFYGHSHGELPEDDSLSCDVGVDKWNYYPVSIDELADKLAFRIEMAREERTARRAAERETRRG